MFTFLACLFVLVAGYFVYGRFVERTYGIDPGMPTAAIRKRDGVDFVPMTGWRIFMVQFLNIAGLGPIFGAIAGAMFGPVAFLWIVLGTLLAGGVHDYLSGMLSERHDGATIGEVVGRYLGNGARQIMRVFSIVLLLLVGVVFVTGPAGLLAALTPDHLDLTFWAVCIFSYYILATLLPIDQLIGRIYPFFGATLLIMAIGISGALLFGDRPMPELTGATFANLHGGGDAFPLFPLLFITVACGAISGFHATQSPLMARCITNQNQGRSIFFGAMVAEGIVALIWAAAAMTFFGGTDGLNGVMTEHGNNPAWAVNTIAMGLLGPVGGVLAIIGVVACPITSGDTAFRSARLTIADMLRLTQGPLVRRVLVALPLFVVGFVLTQVNFGVIWRYFAWSNQTLATVVLWTGAVALARLGRRPWIAVVPATFMTAVCASYIVVAPEFLGRDALTGGLVGVLAALLCLGLLLYRRPWLDKSSSAVQPLDHTPSPNHP